MFGRKIIAELAEIDENLIRSQFTPAQEASAIFRRKAICEELHPETKRGENWKSDQVAKLAKLVTRVTILAMWLDVSRKISHGRKSIASPI